VIQKYERGACRIWIYRLYCFTKKILKVDVAWFFDGLPPPAAGRVAIMVPGHKLRSRHTVSLVEAYFRIAPERRRAVLCLIESMTRTQF
jgi:hypothetical protein